MTTSSSCALPPKIFVETASAALAALAQLPAFFEAASRIRYFCRALSGAELGRPQLGDSDDDGRGDTKGTKKSAGIPWSRPGNHSRSVAAACSVSGVSARYRPVVGSVAAYSSYTLATVANHSVL